VVIRWIEELLRGKYDEVDVLGIDEEHRGGKRYEGGVYGILRGQMMVVRVQMQIPVQFLLIQVRKKLLELVEVSEVVEIERGVVGVSSVLMSSDVLG
jgi:hypothetical protein